MKVDKLLKKYIGLVDVEFYKNKRLIEHTTNRDLYTGYPFDLNNYMLLNSKIKSYSIQFVKDVECIVILINIKTEKGE